MADRQDNTDKRTGEFYNHRAKEVLWFVSVCLLVDVFDTEKKIGHIRGGIQSGMVSPSVRREKDIKRVMGRL